MRPSERRLIAKHTYLKKLWGGRRTGAEQSFVSLFLKVYFLDLTSNTGISRQVCRSAGSQATSQTLWNRFCICDKSPRRFLCKVWRRFCFTNLGKNIGTSRGVLKTTGTWVSLPETLIPLVWGEAGALRLFLSLPMILICSKY